MRNINGLGAIAQPPANVVDVDFGLPVHAVQQHSRATRYDGTDLRTAIVSRNQNFVARPDFPRADRERNGLAPGPGEGDFAIEPFRTRRRAPPRKPIGDKIDRASAQFAAAHPRDHRRDRIQVRHSGRLGKGK